MLRHNLSTYQTKVGARHHAAAQPVGNANATSYTCCFRLLLTHKHALDEQCLDTRSHDATCMAYPAVLQSSPAPPKMPSHSARRPASTPSPVNTPTLPSFAIFAVATLNRVEFASSYHVCDQVEAKPSRRRLWTDEYSHRSFGQPVELSRQKMTWQDYCANPYRMTAKEPIAANDSVE
jgi:hypothetical protein